MDLNNIYSGSGSPLSDLGDEGSIYMQVHEDGRILAWTKRNNSWTLQGSVPSGAGAGGIGGSISDQQVAFGNGTDIAGSDSLTFQSDPNFITIGNNYAAIAQGDNFPGIGIGSNDGGFGAALFLGSDDENTGAPFIDLFSSNGTTDSPTSSADGDTLAQIGFKGYANDFATAAQIQANVSGTVGTPAVPGKLTFSITDDTTRGFVNHLVLDGKTNTATINSILRLPPIADPPGSPLEGMIYADTDHHLYYHNGTTWKQLDN